MNMNSNIDNSLDLENWTELLPLADPTIALDFLLSVKNGVRNASIAITESSTPEVKALLQTQLQQGLALHDTLSKLMISKGWLHPYDLNEQVALDVVSANAVMKIASLELFPPKPPQNTGKEANELGN